MDKIKTNDGVEYTHENHCGQGNVWGAGVGAGIGGGVLGYLLGRSGFGGGIGAPVHPAPAFNPYGGYYGTPYNGGCSESQYVNRFELQQAERAEKLESELAKEKAERYADGIGIATYERMVQYFDKQMERRDNLAGKLTEAVAALDKGEAVNAEKLNCLRDKVAGNTVAIEELGKATRQAIAMSRQDVEEWASCRFVHQPRARVCCEAKWATCPTTTTDGTTTGE
jgi:hypothetical protein